MTVSRFFVCVFYVALELSQVMFLHARDSENRGEVSAIQSYFHTQGKVVESSGRSSRLRVTKVARIFQWNKFLEH